MTDVVQALAYVVPEWARNTASVYISLAIIIGLPGNMLVIAVQFNNYRKTSTDWFVLFMAFSDILSLVVCGPPFIMACVGTWPVIGNSFWCKLHLYSLHTTNLLSAFLIGCIGIDRYNHTVKKHPTINFTSSNVIKTCIGAVVVASSVTVGQIFVVDNNALGQCMFLPSWSMVQRMSNGFLLLLVLAICLILTVMYAKIICSIRHNIKVSAAPINRLSTMVSTNRYRILKTTKIMCIVTFVYIVSTCVPAFAAVFLHSKILKNSIEVKTAVFFLTKGCFVNNCTNPIFYLWLYPSFREKAIKLFRKPK